MDKAALQKNLAVEQLFWLSELRGTPVYIDAEKVGTLSDLVIVDRDVVAEVTHLRVARPFGQAPYHVPWHRVHKLTRRGAVLDDVGDRAALEREPVGAVLLADYILDKKVLDVEGREVEVVYDAALAIIRIHLYVVAVDLSRRGMLRRLGLGWVARFLGGTLREHSVAWGLVEPLPERLGSFEGNLKLKVLKEELARMPASDTARILEELSSDHRLAIIEGLGVEHASDTLEELDPRTQRDLIASLDKEKAARLVDEMTPGQASDLLAVLAASEREAILGLLAPQKAEKLRSILDKQEELAIDFIVGVFLRFDPEATVADARAQFREAARSKPLITYIYVVDGDGVLLGVVDTKALLLADDDRRLKDIMSRRIVSLAPSSTLKQASEMFARYLLRALPVLDARGRILGVLPYRDVVGLRHRYVE
jgi:sporulation protein YlmC with PRC-barrel domain